MNEEQVKKIIKADQQAQLEYEQALEEARQVPLKTAERVKSILHRVQEEAEVEAAQIMADIISNDNFQDEEKSQHDEFHEMEVLTNANLSKAVAFVNQALLGVDKQSE